MNLEQNNTQLQTQDLSVDTPPTPDSPASKNPITEAMIALKKITGSWLMLVLAITCTVTTVFNVIDMIPKLHGFLLIYYLVKVILAIVICVGVWKVYADGRSNKLNASGFKLIKNVISFRFTIIMLLISLIMVLVILAMSLLSKGANTVDGIAGAGGELSSKVDTSIIIVLVVLVGAIAVLIAFFKSVIGSLRCAQTLFENRVIGKNNYYLAAVCLIIIGLFKFIIVFASNALSSIAGSVISSIASGNESMSKLNSLGGLFGSNWSSIVVNICDMLNYVVGGVIIILYAGKIKAIEKANQTNYLKIN